MDYRITAIRAVPSDDFSHDHVDLVGYESPHVPGEPITVPIQRIAQKASFGEKFVVLVDGETVEVTVGKCPDCGHEPHLMTAKDSADRKPLLELARV